MRKYVTPPFWVLIGCIVAAVVNLVVQVNGLYSDDTGVLINKVVLFVTLAVVGYLYKRNPAWDPLVIKAKAEKEKVQAKRRARAQERRERTHGSANAHAKEHPEPRKPTGW